MAPIDFNQGGGATGLSIDYINLIAEKIGIKTEYVNDPNWNRLLELVKNKELDMTHSLVKTDERDEYLNFTKPYLHVPSVYFGRKGDPKINSIMDLEGKKIGVIEGSLPWNIYNRDYDHLNIKGYQSADIALNDLSSGVIDIYINLVATTNYKIKRNLITNIEVNGKDFYPKSKNQGEFRLAFNKDRGILKSIFEAYNNGNHTVNIDKDRNWPFYLDLLDNLTDKPIKIICTVRPPLECAASFGRLYEKEPETYTQLEEIVSSTGFTTLDRAKSMLNPEGSIGKAYSALFEASVVQNRHENMLFLDYHKLCSNPKEQLTRIYEYLDINVFENHNFDKITNAEEQNDLNYRTFSKTHKIEPKLREGKRDLGRLNMFSNEFNCEEFWSSWI